MVSLSDFNFDDFLDDVEEENRPEVRKLKGKHGFELLSLFIGGFEQWPLLNEDCKRKVVEFLDYKSRCKLARCSKSDHAIVESSPIYVHRIEIVDNEELHPTLQPERFECVVVRTFFNNSPNQPDYFELVFSQLEEDTLIRWTSYVQKCRPVAKSVTRSACNFREESVKFFERWLKKCRFEVEALTVEMSQFPFDSTLIKHLSKCQELRVGSDDLKCFEWWISKCPEKMMSLQVLSYSNEQLLLTSELLSLPQFVNVSSFNSWCKDGYTDDQFVALKAHRMSFNPVNITDRGLNMFLKKWAAGKNEHLVKALLWSHRESDQQEVLRGLIARPWDDDFRKEARGFCDDYDRCCGVATCYQVSSNVDPFVSLTVAFSDDRISIYATGRRWFVGGKEATDYSIPL